MVLTQEISIGEVSADMDISVDQIKMHLPWFRHSMYGWSGIFKLKYLKILLREIVICETQTMQLQS